MCSQLSLTIVSHEYWRETVLDQGKQRYSVENNLLSVISQGSFGGTLKRYDQSFVLHSALQLQSGSQTRKTRVTMTPEKVMCTMFFSFSNEKLKSGTWYTIIRVLVALRLILVKKDKITWNSVMTKTSVSFFFFNSILKYPSASKLFL